MPRPTIEGTVCRVIDMYHTSATSNKDYRITISEVSTDQYHVYTEYGPAGRLQNGKRITGAPVAWATAQSKAFDICQDKQNQSDAYTITSDRTLQAQPSAPIQNTKLPAAPKRVAVEAAALSSASRAALNMIF